MAVERVDRRRWRMRWTTPAAAVARPMLATTVPAMRNLRARSSSLAR
jgi:hypothetical protein